MGFYNKKTGRYQLFSDAERREYGEKMREQRRKEWHAFWITKSRLKSERNWTDGAIIKYLGKPKKASQSRYGTIKAYRREDVLAVEQNNEGFKAWLAKRIARQEKAKQNSPKDIYPEY